MSPPPVSGPNSERTRRLEAALRANLRRRKSASTGPSPSAGTGIGATEDQAQESDHGGDATDESQPLRPSTAHVEPHIRPDRA